MNAYDDDSSDPVSRGYRRFRRTFRNYALVMAAATIVIVCFGCPWVQWTYQAYNVDGIPRAADKIEADYWNPYFGWKKVQSGEYAVGCPMVVFIPLKDCGS